MTKASDRSAFECSGMPELVIANGDIRSNKQALWIKSPYSNPAAKTGKLLVGKCAIAGELKYAGDKNTPPEPNLAALVKAVNAVPTGQK